MRDSRHLVRAGVLLAVLLAGFIALRFAIASGALSLPLFALKVYSIEEDAQRWAGLSPKYSGAVSCAFGECHTDVLKVWAGSAHASVECETCHGLAQDHIENTDIPVGVYPDSQTVCEVCHARVVGRPEDFPQVVPEDHRPESTCVSCHDAHEPGPPTPVSHGLEVGARCLECHETTTQETPRMPLNHLERSEEECLDCHEVEVKQ